MSTDGLYEMNTGVQSFRQICSNISRISFNMPFYFLCIMESMKNYCWWVDEHKGKYFKGWSEDNSQNSHVAWSLWSVYKTACIILHYFGGKWKNRKFSYVYISVRFPLSILFSSAMPYLLAFKVLFLFFGAKWNMKEVLTLQGINLTWRMWILWIWLISFKSYTVFAFSFHPKVLTYLFQLSEIKLLFNIRT